MSDISAAQYKLSTLVSPYNLLSQFVIEPSVCRTPLFLPPLWNNFAEENAKYRNLISNFSMQGNFRKAIMKAQISIEKYEKSQLMSAEPKNELRHR